MVALACARSADFEPALLEAGADFSGSETFYSIDVVRHYRSQIRPADRLWFLIGADAFLDLPNWREPEALLDSCDFIIASRPGFRLDELRLVIPPELMGRISSRDPNTIALRKTRVHLLSTVSSHVSSTEIRQRLKDGQSIHGLVPPRVEEYILHQALYR